MTEESQYVRIVPFLSLLFYLFIGCFATEKMKKDSMLFPYEKTGRQRVVCQFSTVYQFFLPFCR